MSVKTEEIINSLKGLRKEELLAINKVICALVANENKKDEAIKASTFNIGDNVYFIHKGDKIQGVIEKINRLSVKVKTNGHGTWSISPSYLRKI